MKESLRSSFAKFRGLFAAKRRILGIAALGAIFIALLSVGHRTHPLEHKDGGQVPTFSHAFAPDFNGNAKLATSPRSPGALVLETDEASSLRAERVMTQAAELCMGTPDFSRSRSSLEEILDRHSGYIAKLRMEAQPSGSILSATLRIPSMEMGRALTDLKSLGHVEREEQIADEVTQQRSDLQARLLNARNSLHRLQDAVKQPSGKFIDEVEAQRQIARLRSEIERLEAEQGALETRVAFSNVLLTLHEERTAAAESLSLQLRTAAVEGLSDALHSLSSILLFLVSYGPPLLLWAVILILPARFVWRRSRQWNSAERVPEQGA